jgi:hypothetical protein
MAIAGRTGKGRVSSLPGPSIGWCRGRRAGDDLGGMFNRSAWGCALVFGLVACQPESEDPLLETNQRLQAAEDRLAAMETKLETMQRDLDGKTKELEALRTEAAAPPTSTVFDAPSVPMAGVDCQGFGTPNVTCKIDPDVATSWSEAPAQFAKQARIVPAMQDGKPLGFKLYGIRPNALAKALGFQNGDLVTTVDGKPLDSLDVAMQAYEDAREREKVVIGFERRNAPITLTIELSK